jgi:hypothetical protein
MSFVFANDLARNDEAIEPSCGGTRLALSPSVAAAGRARVRGERRCFLGGAIRGQPAALGVIDDPRGIVGGPASCDDRRRDTSGSVGSVAQLQEPQ